MVGLGGMGAPTNKLVNSPVPLPSPLNVQVPFQWPEVKVLVSPGLA